MTEIQHHRLSERRKGVSVSNKTLTTDKKKDLLFTCDSCYYSNYKKTCNEYYACSKCKLTICTTCVSPEYSKCINCCNNMIKYNKIKINEYRVAEPIEYYIPIKTTKYCCFF